eukprot:2619038-Rhodomonas_salina.1
MASKSQAPPQVPAVEPSSSLCAAFAMSGTHIAYVASVWEGMPSTDVADGAMCLRRAYAIPDSDQPYGATAAARTTTTTDCPDRKRSYDA